MRKIIQISATADTSADWGVIYALCDDGSVWGMVCPTGSTRSTEDWKKLPPIPLLKDETEKQGGT
jgi:hypothetical protein